MLSKITDFIFDNFDKIITSILMFGLLIVFISLWYASDKATERRIYEEEIKKEINDAYMDADYKTAVELADEIYDFLEDE